MLRTACGAMAALLCTAAVQAAELRLAGPEFPPYYQIENGRPAGHLVDILARVIERAGHTWTGTLYPAARLMTAMTDGRAQATLVVRNQVLDGSPAVLRSPEPVAEMVLNVYSHGTPTPFGTREDLKGKTFLVMRGYGYGGLRQWMDANGVNVQETNSFESAVRMLEAGRVPYALLYDVNYAAGVTALGHEPAGVHAAGFQRVPLYIYLNASAAADAQRLMDELMRSWHALVADGVLAPPANRPETVNRKTDS